jgi:hypothetical protein
MGSSDGLRPPSPQRENGPEGEVLGSDFTGENKQPAAAAQDVDLDEIVKTSAPFIRQFALIFDIEIADIKKAFARAQKGAGKPSAT